MQAGARGVTGRTWRAVCMQLGTLLAGGVESRQAGRANVDHASICLSCNMQLHLAGSCASGGWGKIPVSSALVLAWVACYSRRLDWICAVHCWVWGVGSLCCLLGMTPWQTFCEWGTSRARTILCTGHYDRCLGTLVLYDRCWQSSAHYHLCQDTAAPSTGWDTSYDRCHAH